MATLRNWWLNQVWDHQERWARMTLLLYCAIYPNSVIAILANLIPDEARGFGGVLLLLQGVSIAVYLFTHLGRRAWSTIAIIMIGALCVEYIGATYDFPFGAYDYTPLLGPQLFATVPIVILFAWLMSLVGSWSLSYMAWPTAPRWVRAVGCGFLIMFFDIQIEPVATLINHYWVWMQPGVYYGVPLINFAGWWAVGALLAALCDHDLLYLMQITRGRTPFAIANLVGCTGMFVAMNGQRGYLGAVAMSGIFVVLFGLIVWRWRIVTQTEGTK
ncbi:MAG: carotenoid biosynthesis protein [Chloroflexia bacterium]|nr:carotenoid biosynthesis protein [Chloroflexia bacterium]